MNSPWALLAVWSLALLLSGDSTHTLAGAPASSAGMVLGESITTAGYVTNGPSVYRLDAISRTNWAVNPRFQWTNSPGFIASSNRYPPEVFARLMKRYGAEPQFLTNVYTYTNREFHSYVPGSLNHIVLTDVLNRTNGRTTRIWSVRKHPLSWPLSAPVVEWDPEGLLWGMKGVTALSPCWQNEGSSGQAPVTLLTRRHGYARGHGMGTEGIDKRFSGNRVWFVTEQNKVIEVKVTYSAVRCSRDRDYTVLLFDRDVPSGVDPMRVSYKEETAAYYPWPAVGSPLFLKTEQNGHVGADLPGFTVKTTKGGDSGSPDMISLNGELVFVGGRTTSAPTPEMQEDMDELCRRAHLESRRYQMQRVDLSGFPRFTN